MIGEEKYYRHQLCMMVTYDILIYRHKIQVLIMPKFDEMEKEDDKNFKIVTLHDFLDVKIGLP